MVFEFFNEILLDLYKNCSCVTGGVYFPPDLKFYGYFYEATDCYKIDEKCHPLNFQSIILKLITFCHE